MLLTVVHAQIESRMATSKKIRLERMWRLQSRAIRIGDEYVDGVICPLCMRLFDNRHLFGVCGDDECTTHLTIEHAPTAWEHKQLGLEGDSRRALTCGECNNGAGGTYESRHALLYDRDIPHARSELHEGLKKMNVDDAEETGFTIDMSEMKNGLGAEFVSEMKSAYLIAFAALGYSYCLSPELDEVRDWIRPGISELPVLACNALDNTSSTFDSKTVHVVSGSLRALFVTYPSMHARRRGTIHGVWLPRPGGPGGTDLYETLQTSDGSTVNIVVEERHEWPLSGHPTFHWDV